MRCVARARKQATEAINASGLLSARRERQRDRPAAEQGDEIAALHSITSSARASSVGGISRPSALAVDILMTNSNVTERTTGRSAGVWPGTVGPADAHRGRHTS